MKSDELKALQVEKRSLQKELSKLREMIISAQEKQELLKTKISSIEEKIEKGRSKVSVSEHAILRYIERVMGWDVKAIEDDIKEKSEFAILSCKTGKATIQTEFGRCEIIFKDNTIITVVSK